MALVTQQVGKVPARGRRVQGQVGGTDHTSSTECPSVTGTALTTICNSPQAQEQHSGQRAGSKSGRRGARRAAWAAARPARGSWPAHQ